MPGLADLQLGEFFQMFIDNDGEPAQQPGPLTGRESGPSDLSLRAPYDGGVHVCHSGTRNGGEDLFGGRIEDPKLVLIGRKGPQVRLGSRLGQRRTPHMRSKERRSSQSVTAASKASSSTRAMLR